MITLIANDDRFDEEVHSEVRRSLQGRYADEMIEECLTETAAWVRKQTKSYSSIWTYEQGVRKRLKNKLKKASSSLQDSASAYNLAESSGQYASGGNSLGQTALHSYGSTSQVAPTPSTAADPLVHYRSSERAKTDNPDYEEAEYLNWTPLQGSERSVTQVLEHMKTKVPDSGRLSDNAFSGVYHHLVHRKYVKQIPYHDENQFLATLVRTIRRKYPIMTTYDETYPPPEPSEGEGSTQYPSQHSNNHPELNQAASYPTGYAGTTMGLTASRDAPYHYQGGFLQAPLIDMNRHYTSSSQAYQTEQAPENWAASPPDLAPSTGSQAQQTGIYASTIYAPSRGGLRQPAMSFPELRHGIDNPANAPTDATDRAHSQRNRKSDHHKR